MTRLVPPLGTVGASHSKFDRFRLFEAHALVDCRDSTNHAPATKYKIGQSLKEGLVFFVFGLARLI